MNPNCRLSVSACGKRCGPCIAHGQCRGCAYQLGLTRYGECAIFQCCVAERGLEHCGLCAEFPCSAFLSSGSSEDVERRCRTLRDRADRGTEAWLAEDVGRLDDRQ